MRRSPNGEISKDGLSLTYRLWQWYAGSDPEDSTQLLGSEFSSHGWNWEKYCNPAMEAAQAVALSNYDRPTRKLAYSKIEHLLASDAPLVNLFWPRQIEAVDVRQRGFCPNGIIEDRNAYQWSLAPRGEST